MSLINRQKYQQCKCHSHMIRKSDLQAEQFHVLQSGLFSKANCSGSNIFDQLSIYIGDCTLRVQGFLKNKEELGNNC